MDLLTFNEGIQSIQVRPEISAESGTTISPLPVPPMVPSGESVVRHTEQLFAPENTTANTLQSLLTPDKEDALDPQQFASFNREVISAIHQRINTSEGDIQHMKICKHAESVLRDLLQDYYLMQQYKVALSRA